MEWLTQVYFYISSKLRENSLMSFLSSLSTAIFGSCKRRQQGLRQESLGNYQSHVMFYRSEELTHRSPSTSEMVLGAKALGLQELGLRRQGGDLQSCPRLRSICSTACSRLFLKA